MNRYAFILFFSLPVALHHQAAAQDSLRLKSDSVVPDTIKDKRHSPLFAGLASAIIPGGGQVYNKRYWKVPIVYAALGTAAYFAYYNGNVFSTVKKNLDSRVDSAAVPTPQYLVLNNIFSKSTIDLNQYTYTDLIQVEEDYRRYFTLSIIVGSMIYFLNILDAVVDAHLYHFDVSEDLSMDIRPEIFYAGSFKPAPGFSLSLNLK